MKSTNLCKICIQYYGLFKGLKFYFKNRHENVEKIIEFIELERDKSENFDDYNCLDEFALELQFYHEKNNK